MAADRARLAVVLTGATVAYFLAGLLGLSLAFVNASVSAVWPPSGLAVAILLLFGLRAWPAITAGALLVNFAASQDVASSVAIAAGNTLEGVLAAWLATRFTGGVHAFERGSNILRFALFSAVMPSTIAATIGTGALSLAGLMPPADTRLIWFTWWLGDASGVLLVTPACVLAALPQPPATGSRQEHFGLVAAVAVILYTAFVSPAPILRDLPLAFSMVPLLLWAAFRFGLRTTALLSVVMSAIAVHRALYSLGPFSFGAPTASLLVVQAFIALLSLLMLSVAAEVGRRRQVESEIRALADTLERRVIDRTRELTRVHDRLVEAQAVAHVGSWEWDVAADTLWWSDELCRIFGVTHAPLNYERYLQHVHADDRQRTDAEVQQAAASHRPFSFEHRIVRPDGEIRMLQARGRLEFDDEGRIVRMMGIGHDITERKHAEDERAQLIREQAARREAEEANRAKDAFLATLSHELRTPLNAALGWAHILRESLPEGSRDARLLQTIYRNLLIQSRLVSDILDVSRIARSGLSLEHELVDLAAVVDAAVDMVRDAAHARRIEVSVAAPAAAVVGGDGRRLQQVAWNLLSNAVKFAGEGGRVDVSIADVSGHIELSVADDGPGIAPDFLPHVFEQFRQADASVTREHGGLGLGLAIAQHIVELHHGTIAVANRPGGGAIFTVRLRRVAAPVGDDRPAGTSSAV